MHPPTRGMKKKNNKVSIIISHSKNTGNRLVPTCPPSPFGHVSLFQHARARAVHNMDDVQYYYYAVFRTKTSVAAVSDPTTIEPRRSCSLEFFSLDTAHENSGNNGSSKKVCATRAERL